MKRDKRNRGQKPFPKHNLSLPDLDQARFAVLNSLPSKESQRGYRHAIDEFITWYCSEPRLSFNKAVVTRYRIHLESRQLAPGTINGRLAAIRRLAYEAADSGLLSPDLAAGIRRVKGPKNLGVRLGNWLTANQARALWQVPDPNTLKGKRDRALLAILLGCGLRRKEAAELDIRHLQRREDHWAVVDLVGKARHIRTVPVRDWVKSAIDSWLVSAGLSEGRVFRCVWPALPAKTPDGKWMYFNSNAIEGIHIWRQRFPEGTPEQVTTGPTEEEGIAMAPDGKSFLTAVALENTALWVHDARGERQISLEGNAAQPIFTPDGKKLLYRIVREAPGDSGWYRDSGEVRIADLESGRSEPVVRGLQAFDYDLSPDGREIAMETADTQDKPRIWLAPLDHSAPPHQLPNVEGGYPQYGPDGEILFFHVDSGGAAIAGTVAGYVYRVQRDGSGLKKALEGPVLEMGEVWQQGRRLVAWAPLPKTGCRPGRPNPSMAARLYWFRARSISVRDRAAV